MESHGKLGELQVLEIGESHVNGLSTAFKYEYLAKNADRSSGESPAPRFTD